MRWWGVLVIAVVLLTQALVVRADEDDLASLGLEELMEVEIVTATRRAEPFSHIPGAVTVLDEEDIFHSGAKTLAELLELVPGVHVARESLDQWSVGIRGFNGLLSSKHLVLMDGRPLTSPTTRAVAWGDLIPLSMVKRVEVVRGTWTHLWGADSFTGVINVITKTARENEGNLSVTTGGTSGFEQTARHGGSLGEDTNYSLYASGAHLNNSWTSEKVDQGGSEDWDKGRVGGRIDWTNAFTDTLSLQGDISGSEITDAAGGPHVYDPQRRRVTNGFGQFVWNRALGLDAGINVRTSYTRSEISLDDLSGATNVVDADVQYAAEQWGAHRLTWGVGGRYFWDTIESGNNTSIGQDWRYTLTLSSFVQDRITLYEDSLYLFLGTKLDYLGDDTTELQPSVRLLHTRDDQEYWLAVSRAVRADSRWQRSGSYSIDVGGTIYTVKAPDSLKSENLISYEIGHRRRFSQDLSMDVSLYVNDYSQLVMLEFDKATNTASLTNSLKGTAYGLEAEIEWGATDWLRFVPSVAVIHQNIYGMDDSPQGESVPEKGLTWETKLQTRIQPWETAGFDFFVGYGDAPMERDMDMPGYVSLEAHAYWKPVDALTLELIGSNLSEAFDEYTSLRVGPSLDMRMTWEF